MSTEPQDDATSSSPINHNDRHLYGAIHHMNSDSHSTVMSNSAIEDAPEEVNNKMSYSTKRMAEIRHQIRFETQAIKRWRGILGLGVFLLVALVLVATIVTSNDRKASEDNEQSSYFFFKASDFSAQVKETNQIQRDNLLESFRSFSDVMTQQAELSDWPLVVDPFFEVQGQHIRAATHVEFFAFSPLVNKSQQSEWEAYARSQQGWIQENWQLLGEGDIHAGPIGPTIYVQSNYTESVAGPGPFAPLWQSSPPPQSAIYVNRDILSFSELKELYQDMTIQRMPVVSPVLTNLQHVYGFEDNVSRSVMFVPVRKFLVPGDSAAIVGFMQVVLNWKYYIGGLLPSQYTGTAIVENDCGQMLYLRKRKDSDFTVVDSSAATKPSYSIVLDDLLTLPSNGRTSCVYKLKLLPGISTDVKDSSANILPLIIVALASACALIIFFYQYDKRVHIRNEKLVKSAATMPISASNMFSPSPQITSVPSVLSVEKICFREENEIDKESNSCKDIETSNNSTKNYSERFDQAGNERLKNFLERGMNEEDATVGSAPLADLFLNCTLLYADISGFTAWSSVREPSQVFTLLETLYHAFDEIATRKNVFKVETIGDCYVAVTGLPEPQEDHALIMVRFAQACMYKSYELTKRLEITLGPDTGELSMRFGLHSGPVIAGVLRGGPGDRSRFQLFGETVNLAARIENTGQKGRIHISEETRNCLAALGKSYLLRMREDKVVTKGYGEMTTYWVALGAESDDDSTDEEPMEPGSKQAPRRRDKKSDFRRRPPAVSISGYENKIGMSRNKKSQSKQFRLIDWNVEILGRLLKHVIARRKAAGVEPSNREVTLERPDGQMVLDEVREIITLPKFDPSVVIKQEDPEKIELNDDVKEQLYSYVSMLASMYRQNPFHNYEHATHVTMSVTKLLSRIVAPKSVANRRGPDRVISQDHEASLHDHTYGITSDPLTQFSLVLAALVHDVDHTGIPNSQLVKEGAALAARYKEKSVAEQNSLDLSWDLLMEPEFKDLRAAIYCDEAELTRFRSLLVNAVMATDIVDKELKQARNARWEKAFNGEIPQTEEEVTVAVNRKATIVLEHLIQASDVAHTMQHWHVYRRWNECLFLELYAAYRNGRAEKDPSTFWYKGEIGFFDFYIIPLAKKLKDCGVFGVSSDEYLNYALKNREEWVLKGEAATAEMVAKARDKESARVEKQASMRGPVIAEMKAAVQSVRTPQSKSDMYKQPSFRHLRVDADGAEPNDEAARSFRRQPLSRGSFMSKNSPSVGTTRRSTLKRFRKDPLESPQVAREEIQLGLVDEKNGLRLPERRSSLQTEEDE